MTPTIQFQGRRWRLHKATAMRLIFHPAKSPEAVILKRWRAKQKLNQRAAAERLGISQTHLAKIELGTRNCPPELIQKVENERRLVASLYQSKNFRLLGIKGYSPLRMLAI
jgi:DNA-binding XRE family transcriptional regulator